MGLLGLTVGCDVDVSADRADYAHEDRAARLASICDPKDPQACDDGNPCTDDACDAIAGCQHVATALACNDDDPCTTEDKCADGKCLGKVLDCDDGNPCTGDSCTPDAGCVHLPVPGGCDDGDVCTDKDSCADGKCSGTKLACDDKNPCTTDSCDAAGKPGVDPCKHVEEPATCDDGNPCTDDTCAASTGCAHASNTQPCGADNACMTGQKCDGGACTGGVPTACKDDNPCTDDKCETDKGCIFEKNTASCNDGNSCTSDDTCAAGACTGLKTSCDDGNSCTDDSCVADKGCQHLASAGTCDDGDPCTLPGTCAAKKCVTSGYSCTTDLPCHTAFCQSKTGACTVKVDVDGVACGGGQGVCGSGVCVSTGPNNTQWSLVPAGTFWMGCNSALDASCKDDEKPQHKVTVTKPYWLGVDEVTAAQYKACVDAAKCNPASNYDAHCNGDKPGREKHPINCVPWSEAQGYCKWLGGSLPTEAQWELAARGRCEENGGVKDCQLGMRTYPWGNQTPVCGKHAVMSGAGTGCGKSLTWPVGEGSPDGVGPYGNRDLAGNVWEWVADWSAAYTGAEIVHETGGIGPSSGTTRGARGGAFTSEPGDVRGGSRGAGGATAAIYFVGFRCARNAL